jgi:hypothetical protein
MPVNFPNSPSDNQPFSSSGRVYKYNATKGAWKIVTPATTVTDVSDLTDSTNLLVDNYSELTGNINYTGSVLTNKPTIPADVGDLTDTGGLLGGGGGGGGGLSASIVTGTTQTAVSGNQYILTNVATTTVTLPSSASLGDNIGIVVANDLLTNVVARNGHKIMGLDEDLTLDVADVAVELIYVDSTLGWRTI